MNDPILVYSVLTIAIIQVLSFIMRLAGWYGPGPNRVP
jgi:hypothetical protein